MATLTNEQIEAKKQQLKQLAAEAEQLKNELVEAGASELPDDALEQAAGGAPFPGCVANDMSRIPPTPVL